MYNQYLQPMYGNQQQYVPSQYQPTQFQPRFTPPLQGKIVDSDDIVSVKGIEIPLNGTVSYFPVANGSKIFTKRLKEDGTSEIMAYVPMKMEDVKEEQIEYVTKNDFDKAISTINDEVIKSIKEEQKSLKKQIKTLLEGMSDKDE